MNGKTVTELTDVLYPSGSAFSKTDWATLACFWHPAAESEEVANKPFGTVLLDIRVVVYRSGGKVSAALDICPHRGAQLSNGEMVDGNLQCPYHGLRYDGSGVCTRIPAQKPDAPIPSHMRLTTFDTVERFGIIWVNIMGAENQLAPLPDWSLLEENNTQSARVPTETWNVNAARHAENFNDISHLAFVHETTFGDVPYEVPDYSLEIEENTMRHYYVDGGSNMTFDRRLTRKGERRVPEVYDKVDYEYRFTFPFASSLHITDPDGRCVSIYDVIQPISVKKSRIFKHSARNYNQDQPMDDLVEFEVEVNKEDREVIEPALPVHVPLDPKEEYHIRADRWSIFYRRKLSKYGMGLDVDRVVPD